MSSKTEMKRRKCAKCGKSMKRVAWYYRNNDYYCGSVCFTVHNEKKQQEKAEKAKAAKAEKAPETAAE